MKSIAFLTASVSLLFLMSCQSPVAGETQPTGGSAAEASPGRALWPVSGSTFTHDPTVIKEGATYWQFYTAPGIGVKYSSDGKNWTQGVKVFASNPAWWSTYVGTVTDVWAPDAFYANGRYNLYYCVSQFGTNTSAIGLVSCSSIAKGDWRDDGLVLRSTSSSAYNAIDPEYYPGYLVFGSFWNGINIVSVSTTTFKVTGTPKVIASSSNKEMEGAAIVKNGSYYHLFVSRGLCCKGTSSTYSIWNGRSTSITGPYVTNTGASMVNLGGGTALVYKYTGVAASGGPDFGLGNTLMAYHAYDATTGVARLQIWPIKYDANGWPILN